MLHVYGEEDNSPDVIQPQVVAGTVVWADDKESLDGDDQTSLLWKFDGSGCKAFDNLTNSKSGGARIDTFCKATGIAPKKGEDIEINKENIIGLRAFLDVGLVNDKKVEGKKKNVIIKYITDRGVPPTLETSNTESAPDALPMGDETPNKKSPF